ncbi:amino acid adenylation domain-containing protein [Micromonospora lupini]|uniref:amino acid adenylation domain-containing protein n=1 Tax=Micromonospora lupini TaxID=285679 RepID=UPI00340B8C72
MTAPDAGRYLREAAAASPAATALRHHGTSWSYARLAAEVDRLATGLIEDGCAPGDCVGVLAAKSAWAVAAGQAVMRADAVSVMLDARQPAARLAAICRDCDITTLLGDETLLRHADELRAAGVRRLITLGRAERDTSGPATPPPPPRRGGTDVATLLYTSGSTGLPKAVQITHDNIRQFVAWTLGRFALSTGEVFLSQAHLSFDISTLDIFSGFAVAGTVVLLDEADVIFPRVVVDTIRAERVTNIYVVSSALAALADQGGLLTEPPGPLRRILYGGEVLPAAVLRRVRDWLPPDAGLHNVYGPLESNIATVWSVPAGEKLPDPPPIGRPVPSLRVEIRDPDGAVVPDEQVGEIWVSGPTVSPGYWNRPELTAAKFRHSDGARWYRTGDLGRRGIDGSFSFHGRSDDLVKRRGFRIELGEIEAAILSVAGITECAVVGVSVPDAGIRIHAWFAAGAGSDDPSARIRQVLRHRLPGYMFPDAIAELPTLPKTARDKVDRGRLRELSALSGPPGHW